MITEREVIRCLNCGLNQFKTQAEQCRRCHHDYPKPEPVLESKPEIDLSLSIHVVVNGQPIVEMSERAIKARMVGKRIVYVRTKRELSQRKLAERMGCPRTYISKVERGEALPTIPSLVRFAAALQVEVWRLSPDPLQVHRNQEKAIMSDPFLRELAEYIPHIRRSDLRTLENAARMMAAGQYAFTDWIAV